MTSGKPILSVVANSSVFRRKRVERYEERQMERGFSLSLSLLSSLFEEGNLVVSLPFVEEKGEDVMMSLVEIVLFLPREPSLQDPSLSSQLQSLSSPQVLVLLIFVLSRLSISLSLSSRLLP
jgi:hypothetical protein